MFRSITLEPATPIKMKHHPLDPVMEESLRKHIHQWMTQKVIKEAYYPRSSLLVPVLKKNSEEIWWAVDNRKLNVVTKKDTFPLPNIVNNLPWFSGSKVFSALDGACCIAEAMHVSFEYDAGQPIMPRYI